MGQAVDSIWHPDTKSIQVWVMGLTMPTAYGKMVNSYSPRLQRQRRLEYPSRKALWQVLDFEPERLG